MTDKGIPLVTVPMIDNPRSLSNATSTNAPSKSYCKDIFEREKRMVKIMNNMILIPTLILKLILITIRC